MNTTDSLLRRFQVEEALRQQSFAYPLPIPPLDTSTMMPATGLQPVQLYDIRRRHCLSLFPPSPYGYDAYAAVKTPSRMAKIPAYPPALQDAKLDPKEVQRRRLIALFQIPQIANLVKECWGASLKAESRSQVVTLPPLVYIPRRCFNKLKRKRDT